MSTRVLLMRNLLLFSAIDFFITCDAVQYVDTQSAFGIEGDGKAQKISEYMTACSRNTHSQFKCTGDKFEAWIADNLDELKTWDAQAQSLQLTAGGGLLFMGNSYTGEIYESLLCQLQTKLSNYEALQYDPEKDEHPLRNKGYVHKDTLDNFPLVERHYGVDYTDSIVRNGVAYHHEISRASIQGGAHIYAAWNNRYMFEGPAGMEKLMQHLDVNVSRLDGIFLGEWSAVDIARTNYFPVGYKGMIEPWDANDIVKYFVTKGFKGKVALFNKFGSDEPRDVAEVSGAGEFNISVVSMRSPWDLPHTYCLSEDCLPYSTGHQCIPGIPSQLSGELGLMFSSVLPPSPPP